MFDTISWRSRRESGHSACVTGRGSSRSGLVPGSSASAETEREAPSPSLSTGAVGTATLWDGLWTECVVNVKEIVTRLTFILLAFLYACKLDVAINTEKEIEVLTQYKSIQTISLGKSLKSQWMLGPIVGEINYYSSLLLLIIINKQSFLMYWNLRQQ